MKKCKVICSGIAAALSAAVLLSACGAQTEPVQTPVTDVSPTQTTAELLSAGRDVVTTAAPNADDAGSLTDSAEFNEAFSKRDLSGEYDRAEAAAITFNGTDVQSTSEGVRFSGSDVIISSPGTYILSGTMDNGSVIVDVGKEDKVQLVLDGVAIHSETFAAIYVAQADKVFVTLEAGTVSTLSNGGSFIQKDDNNVDAVIFSKDDLTFNGSGALTLIAPEKHGIVCKDDLVFTDGAYTITASCHAISAKDSVSIAGGSFALTAGKDGIHAANNDDNTLGNIYIAGGDFNITVEDDGIHANALVQIDDGTFTIFASEGIEGTYIRINEGSISISASDDGMNAARKSTAFTPTIEINGGSIDVEMGPGDTDGIDVNGNLIITGGTIKVTGSSAFDYDGSVTFTGGTVYINGQQVSTIPTQMMGGRGGMMHGNMGGMGGMNGMGGGRGGRGRSAVPGDVY